MKIWIDGYEANVEQRVGSGQVAFELIRNLEKIDRENEYTILLPNTPMDDLPKERPGWKYKILEPRQLWTRIALPLVLFSARQKPDLIFSPTHYIPRFSPVKRVATIFDLSYLHFPDMFDKKDLWQLTNWSKFSIKNADHIITISNFSKKDIIQHYGVNKDEVTVAHPGYDSEIFRVIKDVDKIKKIQKKYGTGGDYIIYIGTIQPRKNLMRLMESFSKVISQGANVTHPGGVLGRHPSISDNLKLVVVGKTIGEGRQGWKFEEILETPEKLEIEDRVIFTGFVPTEEMVYLINGAKAFIQPSLWEGFGIPVVEAMACGIPAIVSNVSSLPEVVGKAGLLVDPYSTDQIEQSIRTIVSDKKLHTKLSKMGPEQARKFSWKKMAKEVLKVFEEVGG